MANKKDNNDTELLQPQRGTTEKADSESKPQLSPDTGAQILMALSGLTEQLGALSKRVEAVEEKRPAKDVRKSPTLTSPMLDLPATLPPRVTDLPGNVSLEEVAANIATVPDHILNGIMHDLHSGSLPHLPTLCNDVNPADPRSQREGAVYDYKWTVVHKSDDRLMKRMAEGWEPIELPNGMNKTELIPIRRRRDDPRKIIAEEQKRRRQNPNEIRQPVAPRGITPKPDIRVDYPRQGRDASFGQN